jgi:hypothetical protein
MLDLANILFTIIWSITVPDNCQSCPTYEELNLVYPDNTNKAVSGHIIDNSRTKSNMENEWKYYEQQGYDYLIYYDPPPEIVYRSLHITIQPSIPTYKLNQGISTSLNFTESNNVIFASDRWVGNNCGSASISAKVWASLLGDTMGYMKSGCDSSHTVFNHNATYVYSSDDQESKSFEWSLSSEKVKSTKAHTGELTKQNNILQWQLDLQKYIEKWIDSILHPYELDLSDQEWDRELEKIKEDN